MTVSDIRPIGGLMLVAASLVAGACGKEDKPLTPAELAERTGVTRATITGLVDTLERAGLVTRTPHPIV